MKLYTEEQVIRIAKLYRHELYLLEPAINTETPIELPSDEEIDEQANSHFTIHFNKNGEPMTHIVGHQNPHGFNKFKKTFIKGYKAALEHIRNQNKQNFCYSCGGDKGEHALFCQFCRLEH